jgi:hypothetical protein
MNPYRSLPRFALACVVTALAACARAPQVTSGVRDEVGAGVARRDSLGVIRRAVTLDDERRAIASDEKWMSYLFRNFFLGPVVQRAYEQAKSPPK